MQVIAEENQSNDSTHLEIIPFDKNKPKVSHSIKEVLKKSGFIVGFYAITISGEIFQVYLFSKLGLKSLAASGLIFATRKFVIDPFLILPNQSAVFIAEEFGKIKSLNEAGEDSIEALDFKIRKSQKDIGSILRQGWYLGGLTSILPMGVLFFSGPFLELLGISKEISSVVQSYFIPVAFSLPFMLAANTNERFFSAVDQEKWLIPYRILVSLLNMGLNFLFIPRLGAVGGGLTILIESTLSYVGSTLFIIFKEELKDFKVLNFRYIPENYIKNMLKQGLPITVSLLCLTGTNFAISIFLGHLGNLRLAIEQAIIQSLGLATTLSHGVNEATNRLVAQSLGEKNYRLMRQYGTIGLVSSSLLFTTIAVGYNLFPLNIAAIFMDSKDIQGSEELIRYSFILVSLAKLFAIIQDSTSLSLAAIEDTLISSVTSLLTTLAIILPLSAMSTFLTNLDIFGIGGAMNIGLLIAAGVTTAYWFKTSNTAVNEDDFDSNRDTSNVKFSSLCKSIPFFKNSFRTENEVIEIENIEDVDLNVLSLTKSSDN